MRDQALARARHAESRRVSGWKHEPVGPKLMRAYAEVTEGEDLNGLAGPLEKDVFAMTPEWLTSTVIGEGYDDSVEFLFRVLDPGEGGDVTVETYVVGECPRCQARVPVGPPVTHETLGLVLLTGRPVGHDCPEVWQP